MAAEAEGPLLSLPLDAAARRRWRKHDRRRRRRAIEGIDPPAQLEAPHQIAFRFFQPIAASAGSDRHILLAIDFIAGGRRIRPEPGLKAPHFVSGFRIERAEETIGAAMKQQATRRRQHAASESGEIRHFLLPLLACSCANRGR